MAQMTRHSPVVLIISRLRDVAMFVSWRVGRHISGLQSGHHTHSSLTLPSAAAGPPFIETNPSCDIRNHVGATPRRHDNGHQWPPAQASLHPEHRGHGLCHSQVSRILPHRSVSRHADQRVQFPAPGSPWPGPWASCCRPAALSSFSTASSSVLHATLRWSSAWESLPPFGPRPAASITFCTPSAPRDGGDHS